jgi:hypothetical protein
MAARDVMPVASPFGGHSRIEYFPVKASQTFSIGELVKVVPGTGTAEITVDELLASQTSLLNADSYLFIAAENAYTRTYSPTGTATDTSKAAGTRVGLYPISVGDSIICKNYSTDGAGTATTITSTTGRGLSVGLVVDASGNWFADSHTNTNKIGYVQNIVSRRTTVPGLDNQNQYSGTASAAGEFSVIVKISRDFVAGAA